MRVWSVRFSLVLGWLFASTAVIANQFPTLEELRGYSIEDLANMQITTATRRPEAVRTVPSAVSVIASPTIRRSGAQTIQDALRLGTGIHVARASNQSWAVGIRGFADGLNNKLLVMQDGRSLFSPLFSGVFWDVQDTLTQDIDRIEIVRGPGATMWGSNAVNGVINIITKHAKDTQGALVIGRTGTADHTAAVRYGGQAGERTWYRVYVKGWDRDDIVGADGADVDLSRSFLQAGFRVDSEFSDDIHWMLHGEIYNGQTDQPSPGSIDVSGGNLLGRWTYAFDSESHFRVQAYYDRTLRWIAPTFSEHRDTFDVAFEHRFQIGERHDLLWGADFRVSDDHLTNSPTVAFVPDERSVRTFSAFVQDTITLIPELLFLTLGSKFEHNSYSGMEYQPSIRAAWTPTYRQTVWASVSRAMRAPSRIDTESLFTFNNSIELRGNPDFQAERLTAYKLGYRVQPVDRLTLDAVLFYHDYSRLRSIEGQIPQLTLGNLLAGEAYGAELAVNLQVMPAWSLRVGYSHLQKTITKDPQSQDPRNLEGAEGNDPRHVGFLHSQFDISDSCAFDAIVRHVSSLPQPPVPSYTELDLRLAFYPTEVVEFSIVGRNLLHSEHREFGQNYAVPREVYFQIRWQY